MTNQRGEIKRLPSGIYAIRYRNSAGYRRQRSGFRTRGEARAWLEDELRRVRTGVALRPEVPFRELCATYLATYDRAPSTVSWARYHLGRACQRFGDVPIGRLDASEIAGWRMTLAEGSRHQTIRLIRQVLKQAVAWGWIEKNIALAVANPQPRVGEIVPFESWRHVELVANELGEFGALAILGAGTGLRPQEMFGLERRDIDLSGGILIVRRAYSKGRLTEWSKTVGSTRRVPLRNQVIVALSRQLDDHAGIGPRGIVFPAARGGRIDLHNWRERDWRPAIEAARIEPSRRPYDLRHTYATWSLAAGISIFGLARRMGTSLQMIDRTYGHLTADADDVERQLLDDFDASMKEGELDELGT